MEVFLLPCPFCGGRAEIRKIKSAEHSAYFRKDIPADAFDILHLTRVSKRPTKDWIYRTYEFIPGCSDPKCIGRMAKKFRTESEAIRAWNTRA